METCEAAEAIHSAFPDLGEAPVRALKHGWSHWTFAHGDRVFRFPRTPNDARLLEGEMRLLPLLAPHLPAP
ncbi:MAG: aminoglycoside phosphotransferase, partial [Dehalococcoidia bacterium]|nr:aminoglycoside phosphotransferase [Dehalococcoidia bacterium]